MQNKILLIHNEYKNPGGESIVFKNQVEGLKKNNFDVKVYSIDNNEIDSYKNFNKIKLIFNSFYSLKTIREIKKVIVDFEPDIAIVQNVFPIISPSIYFVLKKNNIPVIQAIFNYRFICPSAELFVNNAICEKCINGNYLNAVRYKCYHNKYSHSLWYAGIIGIHKYLGTFHLIDAYMVPDQFIITKFMEAGFEKEKFFVNPNPFYVTTKTFSNKHKDYFLFVGRLTKQKGIITLLNTYIKHDLKIKLIILGDGEEQETVKKIIDQYNLMDFIELRSPVWGKEFDSLLLNSKCVIIPSEWYDNLPQILCQANAAGKPVIASAINGIPEYISENINGFLFQPGNQKDLAQKINLLNSLPGDKYVALSKSSRLFAETNLDYKFHLKNLRKIFTELSVK